MSTAVLRREIERLYALPTTDLPSEAADVVGELRRKLSAGEVRAAEPTTDGWVVNDWVKKGILVAFRAGQIEDYSINPQFPFFDKSTLPPRELTRNDRIRRTANRCPGPFD